MDRERYRLQLYRGTWCIVWAEAGGSRRRSLRTRDRAAAEQRFADVLKAPQGDTVGAIVAAYTHDLEARGKSAARANDAWKALRAQFSALRPDQVTREICRAYTARRKKAGRAPGTIRKELAVLRSALRWTDKQTPAEIELPPAPAPRDRYLTHAEYRKLRDAAVDPHIRLFIVLAVATAARKEALLELTWDRVDFKRGLIQLGTIGERRSKGRATVPMTRAAREVLEAAHKIAIADTVIEYAGRPVQSIRTGFAGACRRAGLGDVSPHVLRHTAAVWMAEAGTPMTEIAQYLGHDDDRTTQRIYARFSPAFLRGAAAALDVC